jgi:hypothetical protein
MAMRKRRRRGGRRVNISELSVLFIELFLRIAELDGFH